MKMTVNDQHTEIQSLEQLDLALNQIEALDTFELWVTTPNGPFMSMLRSGPHAFLMYLRFSGDAGFSSRATTPMQGKVAFTLANGQVDEYPLSWCLEIEECFQAIAHFLMHNGTKADWILWHED